MPLNAGDPAPSVSAPTQDGATVELQFEAPTVLFFYPRDGTPGCTIEAAQFEAERGTYADADVSVYGISTDTVAEHATFAEEEGLSVPLLADPDGELAAAFDVPIENSRAARTTFVIADGTVLEVYEDVQPDGHARRVLEDMIEDGWAELDWYEPP